MNCVVENEDFQYNLIVNGASSSSMLHALFDGYLTYDLGGNPLASYSFFKNMLLSEPNYAKSVFDKVNDFTYLLNRTRLHIPITKFNNILATISQRLQEIVVLFAKNITPKIPNAEDRFISAKELSDQYFKERDYSDEDAILLNNMRNGTYVPPSIFEKKKDKTEWCTDDQIIPFLTKRRYSSSYIDALVEYIPNGKNVIDVKIVLDDIRYCISPLIELILSHDELVVPTGWSKHTVGFYYKKIDTDVYHYGVFNSGKGLQYHAQQNGKYSACLFYTGSLDDLVSALSHVFIVVSLVDVDKKRIPYEYIFYELSPFYSKHEDYYPEQLEKMRWIYPQLSGTCSYFGFFYPIKYIFYANEGKTAFDKFSSYVEFKSFSNLLTGAEKTKRISQKHKIFVDLISSKFEEWETGDVDLTFLEKWGYDSTSVRNRLETLYTRYETDVSSFTKTAIVLKNSTPRPKIHYLIRHLTNMEYFITSFNRKGDLSKMFMNNLTVFLSKISAVQEFLVTVSTFKFNRFGIHLYSTFLIYFLKKLVDLDDDVYKSIPSDKIVEIPNLLNTVYFVCHYIINSSISGRGVTHFLILYYIRLILIRINRNRNNCYFIPSKTKYDKAVIYNYYLQLRSYTLSIPLGADIYPTNNYFYLIEDYYDIFFSKEYFVVSEVFKQVVRFDVLSYQKYFSHQINCLSKENSIRECYENLRVSNYPFWSVICLVAPLNLTDAIYRSTKRFEDNDRLLKHDYTHFIEKRKLITIYSDSNFLEIGDTNFYSEKGYLSGDLNTHYDFLNFVKSFSEGGDISSYLNNIYGDETALSSNNIRITQFKYVEDLNFNLYSSHNKTDYAIVNTDSGIVVNDYVNGFENYKKLTETIIHNYEQLERMFVDLNDVLILIILDIVLYYGRNLPETATKIIVKHCSAKISSNNSYSEMYRCAKLILDSRNIPDETDTAKALSRRLEAFQDSSTQQAKIKNAKTNIATSLLLSLYNTFLLRLDRNKRSEREDFFAQHIFLVQDFMFENSLNSTVIDRFAKTQNKKILDTKFSGSVFEVTHLDEQGKIDSTPLLLQNIVTDMKNPFVENAFLDQFILKIHKGDVRGLSDNSTRDNIRLEPIGDLKKSEYHLYKDIEIVSADGSRKITLISIQDPDFSDDTTILDAVHRQIPWMRYFYGANLQFYSDISVNKHRYYDTYVEFYNFKNYTSGSPLLLRMENVSNEIKNIYYIDENLREHQLCIDNNPFVVNQWIYDIPISFVYRDGLQYKIVYPDSQMSGGNFDLSHFTMYKWWVDDSVQHELQRDSEKNKKLHYHVAQVDYHGIGCTFSHIEAMRSYLLSCITFMKPTCLEILLPKYTAWLRKLDVDIVSDTVIKLIDKEFVNNPYTYFFKNIVHQYIFSDRPTTDILDLNYETRLHRKVYSKKYVLPYHVNPKNLPVSTDETLHSIRILSYSSNKWFDIQNVSHQYRDTVTQLDKNIRNMSSNFHGNRRLSVDKIISSIYRFNDKYSKCASNISKDSLEDISQVLLNRYTEKLTQLSKNDKFVEDFYNLSRENFIIERATLYYELLDLKTAYEVVQDLRDYPDHTECLEMKTVYDKINSSIIYGGSRSVELILFEILFGWYVRKNQYKIYSKIVQDIDKPDSIVSNYSIHQLLMGKGKTSVIVPLVILHYLYGEQPHGISNIFTVLPQHLVHDVYDSLFDTFYPILSRSWIIPITINRIGSKNMLDADYSTHKKIIEQHTIQKKIFIITDASYKAIKLNSCQKDSSEKIDISNNSVTIFDEFDNQYNPITSNLNFPNVSFTIANKPVIDSSILDIFVDFIVQNVNRISELSHEEVHNYLDVFEPEDFREKFVYQSMIRQFLNVRNLVYMKDYGFPTESSHSENKSIAVPYRAVGTPIRNSEFSEIDTAILTTIFTYVYHDIRSMDVETTVRHIRTKILELGSNVNEEYLETMFSQEKKLLLLYSVSNLRNLNQQKISSLSKQTASSLNTKTEASYLFKKYYLKKIALPGIRFTTIQDNCSFIDVITKKMCNYKAAFSGTVFMDLPTYDEPNRVFTAIQESSKSNGATYSAILGIYDDRIKRNDFPNRIYSLVDDKSSALEKIISLIIQNRYNVLIDSGAYLRDLPLVDIVEQFKTKLHRKYTIYIDDSDTKIVWEKDVGIIPYVGQTDSFSSDDIFIYYDNKHIVGTDIKQPYTLSGLVTVSPFNDLVDIAQATFRMRNLNYGHRVDFIVDKLSSIDSREKLFVHLHGVLYDKMNGVSKMKKIEQEIKSRYRIYNDVYHTEKVFNKYLEIYDDKISTGTKDIRDIVSHLYIRYIEGGWHERISDISVINVESLIKEIRLLATKKLDSIDIEHSVEMEKNVDRSVQTNREYPPNKVVSQTIFYYHLKENAEIPFTFYLRINDWASNFPNLFVLDVFVHTEDFQRKNSLLNMQLSINIFWSPLMKYYDYRKHDMFYNLKIDIRSHDNYPHRYIQMLNSYDYYYAKYVHDGHDALYYLFSSRECLMLIQHIMMHPGLDRLENVWIKDKRGNILLGSPNDMVTAKEIYVRLLLGKVLTTEETVFAIAFMRENKQAFDLVKEFSKYYEVTHYDVELYEKHISTSVEEFKHKIRSAVDKQDKNSLDYLFDKAMDINNEELGNFFTKILMMMSKFYDSPESIQRGLSDVSYFIGNPRSLSRKLILYDQFDLDHVHQIGGYNIEKLKRKVKKYKQRYLALKRLR